MKLAKQFKIWIAIVLLVASILIIVNILFNPQPIQIILETGQEVSTKSSNYFAITTVMILVICSFVTGASITHLFYKSDNGVASEHVEHAEIAHQKIGSHEYDRIIPLLRDDEKKAVRIIREHNGEILQNELVLKLGLSKVRTTRIIASLERKEILTKQRHGITNSIKLK